ncbi:MULTISPECIES: sedoheptulose 7-phosphate cyclase [unclassified Streptomyces]|uniref:sedoheptulose 7-phosphate cyclase n=1 Tax=unclassified Streptomyces TaxID=2593676 RepID=UPI001F03FEAE|nr:MULTISPECIES: sedoheptulose 7-phosphate cyclase [unclassified Streptomyces]MCH0566238.1 sedoheptulose 7-phosphate cyclase [Streptomyces sp. MUM 2J]MCH0568405.1 sedoheptulose 7-phosphate cyclase [Streptomyces sp. MUM 136J]
MQQETQTARDNDGLFAVGSPVTHWSVQTSNPVQYEIRACENLLDPGNSTILEDASSSSGQRRFIVTDRVVDSLYGERIRAYFDHHGVEHRVLVLDDGETHKSVNAVLHVTEALDAFGVDRRREPVIAIGGGVLMDIVGFAASLYRRSTPFIRIPTTLIGLVDAGVGAKTGVNHNGHKNRLGTYFPADRTLLDRSFLATLDTRHISNGLAEILKIALIKDARLFDLLEQHGADLLQGKLQSPAAIGPTPADVPVGQRLAARGLHLDPATEVVERAIQGMLEELQPNLWEKVLERVVDYGHTFSPTIEMHALPALLHGEAVAVDMALTTVMAERRGLVSAYQRDRILGVMARLGLPARHPLCTPEVLGDALRDTVRHRDGKQRLPLPVGIGSALFVNDVTESELAAAAESLAVLGSGVSR